VLAQGRGHTFANVCKSVRMLRIWSPCMFVCMYVCMNVCMYAFVRVCMHAYMYVRKHMSMIISTSEFSSACLYVCMQAFMHVEIIRIRTHIRHTYKTRLPMGGMQPLAHTATHCNTQGGM